MLLTEKIDTDDFREMNAECKAQLKKLKAKLFLEILAFDGVDIRITRISEAARIISSVGEGLGGSEKGQSSFL